jgi:endonuclease/exonuclease/phosphatase family metal-dependent hydrolase
MVSVASAQEIKVMSYNIRYDEPWGDGENAWSYRREVVASLMNYYAADFIGTQETQPHQLKFLLSKMPNYSSVGAPPSDADSGVAYKNLLYNKNKYAVVSQHFHWLTPDGKKAVGWDAALIRWYTYGLFKDKKTGKHLWVITAHFDHEGDTARLESAKIVWKRIAELKKQKNCPVIFMGDLNGLPEESSIQYLDTAMSNTRKVSMESPHGPLDTWNDFKFTSKLDGCYDYIFIEKGKLTVNKFITITDSYDMKYPSDHLPVMAHIIIP